MNILDQLLFVGLIGATILGLSPRGVLGTPGDRDTLSV